MQIETSSRQEAIWDESKKDFIIVSEDNETTYFDVNRDWTKIKHTTPKMKSFYEIKSITKNEEKKRWDGDVISDAGNQYQFILDPKNNNVCFIFSKEGSVNLTLYTIKEILTCKYP